MKTTYATLLLTGTALCLAAPSYAQTAAPTDETQLQASVDPQDETAQLDEIVVTSQRRSERLQDVPQTVNVVTSEQLTQNAIVGFQEVQKLTPGLSLSRTSASEQSVSLRGVKMPNGGGPASTVDIYLNEVPINAAIAFNAIYDLQQFEVVRGPQGTARGRLSPSGSILLTTARPNFDVWSGEGILTVGDLDTLNVQAAFGGPVTDTLAVRFAGVYDESDDNDVKSIVLDDESHHHTSSGRVTAVWTPTDAINIELIHQELRVRQQFYRGIQGTGLFSRNAGQTYSLQDRVSLDAMPNAFDLDTKSTSLNAAWDLGDNRLSYIFGYQDTDQVRISGQNYSNAPSAVPSSVNQIFHDEQTTHEVRFESVGRGFWNYLVGAYYEDAEGDSVLTVVPLFSNRIGGTAARTKALFTSHRFAFTQADTLEAGVRYTDFESSTLTTSAASDAVTANASFKHRFNPDLLAYASFGTSYRPGGAINNTVGNPIPARFFQYEEEKSTAYEVGFKTTLFDGMVDLDVAAYHQAFDNYIGQTFNGACTGVPSTTGLSFATNNGLATGPNCSVPSLFFNGDAISQGIELSARAQFSLQWTMSGNFAYADAKYDDATVPCNDYNGDGTPDAVGVPRIQTGQFISVCQSNTSLGQLPAYSFSVLNENILPWGSLELFAREIVSYQSSAYFPQTAFTRDSLTQVDLYAGVRSAQGEWELTVFAKNLLDNDRQDTEGGRIFATGQDTGYSVGTVLRPREIGVTLRRRFGG